MTKKKITWILALVLVLTLVRGVVLWIPLYTWGRLHGIRVRISPLSAFGRNWVVLSHVRINNSHGEILFSVDKLRIKTNPLRFFSGEALASMQDLELEKPTFFFHRDPKGIWNWHLAQRKIDWLTLFRPKINVKQGEFVVSDEYWKQGVKPSQLSVNSVEGFLDFTPGLKVAFHLRGKTGLQGELGMTGSFSRPTFSGTLLLKAQSVPLSRYGNYLLHQPGFQFIAGVADGKVKILLSRLTVLTAQGNFQTGDGAMASTTIETVPITHLSATLAIDKPLVRIEKLKGFLGASPFEGNGFLVLSESSKFFLTLRSASFDLENLIGISHFVEKLHPSGRGSLALRLSGAETDFFWEGGIRSPEFFLNRAPARALSVDFSQFNDFFSLDEARWKRDGGTVVIRGASKRGEFTNFLVQGKNIPVSDLSWVESLGARAFNLHLEKVTGRATLGALFARFHGEDILAGEDQFDNLSYQRAKIRRLSSKVLFSTDKGWVDDLQLSFENGELRGNGSWMGRDNPYVSGEARGELADFKIHPYLFGTLKELFLIDPRGALRWETPSTVSGLVSSGPWTLRMKKDQGLLSTTASGSVVVKINSGRLSAGLGLGKISRIQWKSLHDSLRAVPSFSSGGLDWSLGVHRGRGGYSLLSPTVALFGQLTPGSHQLNFVGQTLPTPTRLAAVGQWKSSASHPQFSLSLLAAGEELKKHAALLGDVSGEKGQIHLEHLEALWGEGLVDLNGEISLAPEGALRLQGFFSNAEIEEMARLFPASPFWLNQISGEASGKFTVSGERNTLGGDLHLSMRDGSLFGEPLSMAYLDARIRDGVVYFNPLVARADENYFTARGKIGRDGSLDLSFDAPQISLASIQSLRPIDPGISGQARLKGKIGGNIFSPSVWAALDLRDFHATHLAFERMKAKAAYSNKTFQIRQARFSNGTGELTGDASFDLVRPYRIKTQLAFSHFGLAPLLTWSPMESFGLVDGTISMNGPPATLNGNFDLHLGEQGAISGEARGSVQNGVAAFSVLNLKVGSGELSGSGKLNMERPSELFIKGKNLDLEFLANLFHWPGSPSGVGSFTGQIRTSLENPRMSLDVTVDSPAAAGFGASALSGRVIYESGALTLSGGQLFLPHGILQMSGSVPVSLRSKHVIQTPFSLNLKLEDQNLRLVSDLFPAVDASGSADANVDVLFRPDSYLVNGRVSVLDGKLALPGMLNEIEKLQGTFTINQNNLHVDLNGELENPFRVNGNFVFPRTYAATMLGDGTLNLTGSRLAIDLPYAQFHLNPTLELSHHDQRWKLSGTAEAEDGDIQTELFSSNLQKKFFPKLGDLELDATVKLGSNLEIHHPHLDAPAQGTLKIAGTLVHPEITGDLTGDKGTLVFLGYTFELHHGEASFDPGRALPYLNLSAASVRRIQGSRIFLHLTGYPNDLHVGLAADPPLTQSELSMTLTQQQPSERYTSGGSNVFMQQEASRWLNTGIQSQVFYPIENVLGPALSLENFSFNVLPTGQLGLQVGKEISPHLTVTYSRAVAGHLQNQTDPGSIWGLDYHLSPRIVLRGTQDTLTGLGGQIVGRWDF